MENANAFFGIFSMRIITNYSRFCFKLVKWFLIWPRFYVVTLQYHEGYLISRLVCKRSQSSNNGVFCRVFCRHLLAELCNNTIIHLRVRDRFHHRQTFSSRNNNVRVSRKTEWCVSSYKTNRLWFRRHNKKNNAGPSGNPCLMRLSPSDPAITQ